MTNFLDSHTTDGKIFDRNLADKIFRVFDVNADGKISIDEFIKTYIHMEEDLKSHKEMVLAKKNNEENKKKEYSNKLEDYNKIEKKYSNGMSNLKKKNFNLIGSFVFSFPMIGSSVCFPFSNARQPF